jgi:MscS family membrane protein
MNTPAVETILPKVLVDTRLATIPLFQWLAILVGLPSLYILTGLLSRLLRAAVAALLGRSRTAHISYIPGVLPTPIRLLLVALIIRWLLAHVGLPLLARQFWSTLALVIGILAVAWLMILANGWAERYTLGRLQNRASGSAAVLSLIRRMVDGLVLFAALLFTLYHFGVNPTAAFAGLGVGGIAVALAAQKTLENVVGGISIIADRAVHVGDFLKLGDVVGTVETVGLRSTRIRTLDRTMVIIPNGQIANMSLETLSARDRFWFHPLICLRYETSASQIREIVNDIRTLLMEQRSVDSNSVQVRLLRLGEFSLDLDIFAYVYASDWNRFLETQQEFLLRIIDIVEQRGAEIAYPSKTMYFATYAAEKSVRSTSAPMGAQTGGPGLRPKPTWRGGKQ